MAVGAKEELSKALALLKPLWYEFLDTLVTGECGCHFAVTIVTKSIIRTTCGPEDTQKAIFGASICEEEVEQRETIDMPVFFAGTKFTSINFYVPQGQISIMTTLANMEKLQKAEYIIVCDETYQKASEQKPCGPSKEYAFYSMDFKKCA